MVSPTCTGPYSVLTIDPVTLRCTGPDVLVLPAFVRGDEVPFGVVDGAVVPVEPALLVNEPEWMLVPVASVPEVDV